MQDSCTLVPDPSQPVTSSPCSLRGSRGCCSRGCPACRVCPSAPAATWCPADPPRPPQSPVDVCARWWSGKSPPLPLTCQAPSIPLTSHVSASTGHVWSLISSAQMSTSSIVSALHGLGHQLGRCACAGHPPTGSCNAGRRYSLEPMRCAVQGHLLRLDTMFAYVDIRKTCQDFKRKPARAVLGRIPVRMSEPADHFR